MKPKQFLLKSEFQTFLSIVFSSPYSSKSQQELYISEAKDKNEEEENCKAKSQDSSHHSSLYKKYLNDRKTKFISKGQSRDKEVGSMLV